VTRGAGALGLLLLLGTGCTGLPSLARPTPTALPTVTPLPVPTATAVPAHIFPYRAPVILVPSANATAPHVFALSGMSSALVLKGAAVWLDAKLPGRVVDERVVRAQPCMATGLSVDCPETSNTIVKFMPGGFLSDVSFYVGIDNVNNV
jgi:hypothetical protein